MNNNLNFTEISYSSNKFGLLSAISKSLLLSFAAIVLCVSSTACTSPDKTSDGTNNATSTPQADAFVKAKVAIPKGLTFTKEMLDFGKLKTDTDAKTKFRTKEELIGKKAANDIAQDKVITATDVAPKEEDDDDDETVESSETKETKKEEPAESK